MGELPIVTIEKEQAEHLDSFDYQVSLKIDGSLIYFKNNKLFSPRCDRSDRYKHILDILIKNNMPSCIGEVFLNLNSNVFDVSRSENWKNLKICIFDLLDSNLSLEERQKKIDEKVKEINSEFVISPIRFNDFKTGWEYVLANNSEGVCIRNNTNWYKCKLLQNTKMEIVRHEVGKDKGTFILANGNRLSGTSTTIVLQYLDIKKRGKKAIAEISYPFITKEGHFFQPRLTNMIEVENETQ